MSTMTVLTMINWLQWRLCLLKAGYKAYRPHKKSKIIQSLRKKKVYNSQNSFSIEWEKMGYLFVFLIKPPYKSCNTTLNYWRQKQERSFHLCEKSPCKDYDVEYYLDQRTLSSVYCYRQCETVLMHACLEKNADTVKNLQHFLHSHSAACIQYLHSDQWQWSII